MVKNLVIVESPAKADTIKKYLGRGFKVLASYGHVRDLVPKGGAVDPTHDFAMRYQLIEKNEKHVEAIAKAIVGCETLFLATDPDREGEAIAFHVLEILKERNLINNTEVKRIVFYEITKKAVQGALDDWRPLSDDLVNAQQARRALDYLVGFNLSPLLWKKVRPGLSAGRVQSPALKMIAEREEEIERFESKEYWSINAQLTKDKIDFVAKLSHYQHQKLSQFSITETNQAEATKADLLSQAKGKLEVVSLETKKRKRNPAAPFTTSTLQQEASRKVGFGAQKTMRIAQQLYEGIDLNEERVGLITYMRTDSVNMAQEAIEEIRQTISDRYGKDMVPEKPHTYKTKSKNAQEAHEAIRPTSVLRDPTELKPLLSLDQYKLYELIWKRAMACQMIPANISTVVAELSCGEGNLFRASGSTILEAGFLKVYEESLDESKDAKEDEGSNKKLPPLEKGDQIKLLDIENKQHFTEPPPRYSEASLVKALEEHGIGRPSTYASIISTLLQREYAKLENKRFIPTDVGRVVNKFLTQFFQQYVDYDFTAMLENQLDDVARGEKEYIPLLKDFWQPFSALVKHTEENVQRKDVTQEALDEKCPECQAQLATRLGRRGRFIGCTAYPECKYTRNLDETAEAQTEPEIVEGRTCPACEKPLQIRKGRYGKFIGCTGYPECKHMEPLEKPADTQVSCPVCHEGTLLKRKSRYGKIFYSCSTYPKCNYAVWNPPVTQQCPDCEWPLTVIKTTKRKGTERVCPQKECTFAESYDGEQPDFSAQ